MTQFEPWAENVLAPNQRLGLLWAEGVTFHHVLGVERTRVANYGGSQWPPLGSGATQGPFELQDTLTNKVIEVPEANGKDIILDVGIGIKPNVVRVYPQYPYNEKLGRILAGDQHNVGADRGFVTGEDTPFENPTMALSFLVPFAMKVGFEFSNPDLAKAHWVHMNIEMAKYRVRHMKATNKVDAEMMRRMAGGSAPVRLATIGKLEKPEPFPAALTRLWDTSPTTIEALLGGG